MSISELAELDPIHLCRNSATYFFIMSWPPPHKQLPALQPLKTVKTFCPV